MVEEEVSRVVVQVEVAAVAGASSPMRRMFLAVAMKKRLRRHGGDVVEIYAVMVMKLEMLAELPWGAS